MSMDATLTWIDLTANDRDKIRRVLDLFQEQGTVDEMGLGNLRDGFSDALFPGTSTIQTRLRYVLFIPWIYQHLERQQIKPSQITERARAKEIQLIDPLKQNEDSEGTIGGRSYDSLARLPSSVYWNALVRWEIFQHPQSQGWYHSNFDGLRNGDENTQTADDPGVDQDKRSNWHPRLPKPSSSFPNEVSFDLTNDEACFIQGRIGAGCSGTLLAWFAQRGMDTPENGYFWDDHIASLACEQIRKIVKLARRFSLHVEGMSLLYNLLLAEQLLTVHKKDDGHCDNYRKSLKDWATRESAEEFYDPTSLWAFTDLHGVRVPPLQLQFIEHWSERVNELRSKPIVDDQRLRDLIANREKKLKKKRARLVNTGRLLDWNGSVGVGRMDFRWYRVRRLLMDLHKGLNS